MYVKYIMKHGENVEGSIDGGLTDKGKSEVNNAILKFKRVHNKTHYKQYLFAGIVTSDSRCCRETAEIAADILNCNIEKSIYELVKDFEIRVTVSELLRGRNSNESEKEFYERVRVLLNNETINNNGISVPSPLLLQDDDHFRTHLLITDQSMINAIYRYYGSYNPQLVELAEKQYFAHQYASLYKIEQFYEEYNANEQDKSTSCLHTGFIRKYEYTNYIN